MKTLIEILSLKRPHGGKNERSVALDILVRLQTANRELMVFNDARGQPMAYAMTTDDESRTLFTAHLDTVHKDELTPNPVQFDPEMKWMWKEDGTALGADDGAGVWLLYKMIEANVPGTYLFPLGEECGGIGAKWIASNAAAFLSKFDRAVAFDRADTADVITHQGFGRCCSDKFAKKLARELTRLTEGTTYPAFEPDNTGVYTDTAEFTDIISECTNISVGYKNQHGGKETLDTQFLEVLLEACLKLDWSALPAARDPKAIEPSYWGKAGSWAGGYDWETNQTGYGTTEFEVTYEELAAMTDYEIEDLVYQEPEAVARMLMELRGFQKEDE